jgi:hypothetical protein
MSMPHHHEKSPLESRVVFLERAVEQMRDAVKSIDGSLKELVRLGVAHEQTRDAISRAFQEIEDHEARLRQIEVDMPTIRLIRGWVLMAVVGVFGIVGIGLVGMMLR